SRSVFFAQDAQHRHVAIKLVKKNSDEYRIACFLHECSGVAVERCIIPILEIIDCEEHAFMVMPRWGEIDSTRWFYTMRGALDYVHSTLKGLAFLHAHGIVHRDLKEDNIMCNHFGSHFLRQQLATQQKLVFAIADFDLSLMLPPSSQPRCCRLPTRRSWEVIVEFTHDVLQGELDYDPFLLDVGTLGLLFARYFEKLISLAPMLAPLIDGMVTDDLSRRFTASEALQFFEQTADSVPTGNLDIRVDFPFAYEPAPAPDRVYSDRWVGLPPDFVAKWSAYRVQKPDLLTRVLRWFCSLNARTFFMVQSIR
ncbi:kinase-like protein, partial [Fistulina hepatica ATCC 64428]